MPQELECPGSRNQPQDRKGYAKSSFTNKTGRAFRKGHPNDPLGKLLGRHGIWTLAHVHAHYHVVPVACVESVGWQIEDRGVVRGYIRFDGAWCDEHHLDVKRFAFHVQHVRDRMSCCLRRAIYAVPWGGTVSQIDRWFE